jgi:hypothetical protein
MDETFVKGVHKEKPSDQRPFFGNRPPLMSTPDVNAPPTALAAIPPTLDDFLKALTDELDVSIDDLHLVSADAIRSACAACNFTHAHTAKVDIFVARRSKPAISDTAVLTTHLQDTERRAREPWRVDFDQARLRRTEWENPSRSYGPQSLFSPPRLHHPPAVAARKR